MKRFTKIAVIIASILAVIGITCVAAAFVMGIKFETFTEMLNHGKFSIGNHTIHLFDDSTHHTENMKEDCKNLEIELAAGILEIYYSDIDEIQIDESGVPGFEFYTEDGTLHIEGGSKLSINQDEAKVTVMVPNETRFHEVELELGAGKSTIEDLITDQLHVELGAGEAVFENLATNQLEAEVGAGKLQIELDGSEDEYSYDIECAVGKIQIGDNSFGGLGETQKNMNAGTGKLIDLECAIGEIQVGFTN